VFANRDLYVVLATTGVAGGIATADAYVRGQPDGCWAKQWTLATAVASDPSRLLTAILHPFSVNGPTFCQQ